MIGIIARRFTWKHRELRRVAAASLLALLAAVLAGSVAFADASATSARSRLLEGVKFLASDELEGRGVRTEGIDRAAEFIREQFAAAGLNTSRAGGDAFQEFTTVVDTKLGSPNRLVLVAAGGDRIELEYDAGFRTCSFGGSGEFRAPLVFCGYGIDAPSENFREFEGVDVEGRVAIIMRRVPQQDNPHGPFSGPHGGISRHADLRTKVSNAYRNGAAAVLFVNDPYTVRKNAREDQVYVQKVAGNVAEASERLDSVDPQNRDAFLAALEETSQAARRLTEAADEARRPDNDPLMDFSHGRGGENVSIPVMHITQEACNRVLSAALEKTLSRLAEEIDRELEPRSAALSGWSAEGAATIERVEKELKNVVGVLEGEGPLAEETIIIGAHYDHIGYGGPGSLAPGTRAIHNGADDNASGTVCLIELARRLASREKPLPRRIVFIAFTAEEMGLIGSAHYVKQPVFPLEKTVAMFNMDMVGRLRDDELTAFGVGTSSRWGDLMQELAGMHGFELSTKEGGFGPSDHSSFYAREIPVLHFFTGTHSDYHRPSDDWPKLNVDGMLRIVDLLEGLAVATAESAERPEYVAVKSEPTVQRAGSRPYFGSIPDFSGGDAEGYAISGVSPGSPADEAGLQGGDRIVKLGSHRIGGLNDFDLALRKFSAGEEVEVVVQRDGKELILEVTLAKPR